MAVQLADEGWKAIKLRLRFPTMKEDIAVVEEVRKAIGKRMEIPTDANQATHTPSFLSPIRWDLARAELTARELERLECYYLEEPLAMYAFDDLAELCRRVSIPIAGGETNRGFHEFLWMMRKGAYDIIQPEVLFSGGITGCRKVAAVAEAFNKYVIPHNGGMPLGTIAHLHLVASWPNSPYMELLHDPPIGDYRHNWAIFRNPPVCREGPGSDAAGARTGGGNRPRSDPEGLKPQWGAMLWPSGDRAGTDWIGRAVAKGDRLQ